MLASGEWEHMWMQLKVIWTSFGNYVPLLCNCVVRQCTYGITSLGRSLFKHRQAEINPGVYEQVQMCVRGPPTSHFLYESGISVWAGFQLNWCGNSNCWSLEKNSINAPRGKNVFMFRTVQVQLISCKISSLSPTEDPLNSWHQNVSPA